MNNVLPNIPVINLPSLVFTILIRIHYSPSQGVQLFHLKDG